MEENVKKFPAAWELKETTGETLAGAKNEVLAILNNKEQAMAGDGSKEYFQKLLRAVANFALFLGDNPQAGEIFEKLKLIQGNKESQEENVPEKIGELESYAREIFAETENNKISKAK